MKKTSKTGINILIFIILILVLALGILAIVQYGRFRDQMEEKARQEAQAEAEATVTPTQTPTPEPTPDPSDPEVIREQLIRSIQTAIEENNVNTMANILRYTASDGSITAYPAEDVAEVLLHLKRDSADYWNFFTALRSESTSVNADGESQVLVLSTQDLRKMTNTAPKEGESIQPETPVGEGKMVAIDAGHQAQGDSNQEPIGPGASQTKARVASGTSGCVSGVPEYELNLTVALKLRDELERRGYSTYMIREDNEVNVSNAERAQLASQSGADILVRIHANGSENSSVAGALTMAPSTSNPYVDGQTVQECQRLSQLVIDSFCAVTGAQNQGVYQTDEMSGLNWCAIPATLVEMGYMTNPEEDARMQTEEYQALMVQGIADGIDSYFTS